MALTRDEFFDDDFDMDLGGLRDNVSSIGGELFPVDALSDNELAEFNALTQRARRLSPIDIPTLRADNSIRGNPYSTNTAPVLNAVTQGLEKVINAARQRRMMRPTGEGKALAEGAKQIRERANQLEGDERRMLLEEADAVERAAEATSLASRLGALQTKAQNAKVQQEQQNEFMMTLFPDLANRLMDTKGDIKLENVKGENAIAKLGAEYGFDVNLENLEQINELAKMDKELENELTILREKGEGGGSGGGRGVTGQDLNNLRQVMVPMLDRIQRDKKALTINTTMTPEQKEAAKQKLDDQYNNILNTVFSKAAAAAGIEEEEIRALINITDEQVRQRGEDDPNPDPEGDNQTTDPDSSAVRSWWDPNS